MPACPYHTVLDDASSPTAGGARPTTLGRASQTRRSASASSPAPAGRCSGPTSPTTRADSFLISDVGWWPDSSAAYCYVQNRVQTWLDFVKFTPGEENGSVKRLFRDTTKAWIESPGPVHWLKDGTFLWLSERDGWKHLYHYGAEGTLKAQLTPAPWEVRAIEHVDSKDGWIYFTGTRDNPDGGRTSTASSRAVRSSG